MSTLRFRGLDLALDPEVYAPAEDTELLADALDLLDVGPGHRACDVGTGTGALALLLARRGARVVAVDVNPLAVALARANARRNRLGPQIEALRGSLLAPLRGPFDVIVFNPPYLPVAGELRGELPRAWEGGERGIGWAPLFLAALLRCLAPDGRVLVLLSSLGSPGAFRELALARGLVPETVASARLPWETLEVLRLRRGNL